MMSWVARMLRRFYTDRGCPLTPPTAPDQRQIEGDMREVQQLVRSTASLISRTATENSKQAKEITEKVRELNEAIDVAYATAKEAADFIFNESQRRGHEG
jgi:ElaB/YqjD/DUF883 family membrane-anchored ribosome-binding protein